MVIKIFRVLAKRGLCSICSQNLDECSLARARKIFAIARMLGFSLKFALLLKSLICKSCYARIEQVYVTSQNMELNSFGSGREIIAKLRYRAHSNKPPCEMKRKRNCCQGKFLKCSLFASYIQQSARCSQDTFDHCSCSQKEPQCSHARKCSQRPFDTPFKA